MKRLAAIACFLVGACAAPAPPPVPTPAVPPAPVAPPVPEAAPVVPRPAPEAGAGAPLAAPVPGDALYVCVSGAGAGRTQAVIEFPPRVLDLCRRHPEMGPCQYERNACRQRGGRVYTRAGAEITMATEAEYDRKVLRRQFRAN